MKTFLMSVGISVLSLTAMAAPKLACEVRDNPGNIELAIDQKALTLTCADAGDAEKVDIVNIPASAGVHKLQCNGFAISIECKEVK